MNKVLNLLLTITVFFGGWKVFPNVFWFESTGAVVISVLIKYGISVVLGVLMVVVTLSLMVAFSDSIGKIIILFTGLFVVVLLSNMLEVWLISKLAILRVSVQWGNIRIIINRFCIKFIQCKCKV